MRLQMGNINYKYAGISRYFFRINICLTERSASTKTVIWLNIVNQR